MFVLIYHQLSGLGGQCGHSFGHAGEASDRVEYWVFRSYPVIWPGEEAGAEVGFRGK